MKFEELGLVLSSGEPLPLKRCTPLGYHEDWLLLFMSAKTDRSGVERTNKIGRVDLQTGKTQVVTIQEPLAGEKSLTHRPVAMRSAPVKVVLVGDLVWAFLSPSAASQVQGEQDLAARVEVWSCPVSSIGQELFWSRHTHVNTSPAPGQIEPGMSSVCCGDAVIFFGGGPLVFDASDTDTPPQYQSSIYSFDTKEMKWATYQDPHIKGVRWPKGRSYHAATYLSPSEPSGGLGEMYIFGGYGPGSHSRWPEYSKQMWCLDLNSMSWRRIKSCGGPVPEARASHSMCTVRGDLYVYGGRTGTLSGQGWTHRCLADIWRLNISTRSWHHLDVSNQPRAGRTGHHMIPFSCPNRGRCAVIIGGRRETVVVEDGTRSRGEPMYIVSFNKSLKEICLDSIILQASAPSFTQGDAVPDPYLEMILESASSRGILNPALLGKLVEAGLKNADISKHFAHSSNALWLPAADDGAHEDGERRWMWAQADPAEGSISDWVQALCCRDCVRSLKIGRMRVTLSDIAYISQNMHSLREFSMQYNDFPLNQEGMEILASLPSLRVLDISGCEYTEAVLKVIRDKMQGLVELRIDTLARALSLETWKFWESTLAAMPKMARLIIRSSSGEMQVTEQDTLPLLRAWE